uniref:Putative ovule protein n=1 Tax=Solanum chacoense TaxID=4108 RepID=A0A0V0HAU7_SOLCH
MQGIHYMHLSNMRQVIIPPCQQICLDVVHVYEILITCWQRLVVLCIVTMHWQGSSRNTFCNLCEYSTYEKNL